MASKRADELTDNQRRFVDEYLIDRNGVQAYLRAFGRTTEAGRVRSYMGAAGEASKLLKNPKVKAEIAAAERDYARRCRVRADAVLREAAGIAFLDVIDLFDLSGDTPRLRSVRDMPARARRAIASIKVKRTPVWEPCEGGGRVKVGDEEVIEVKACDKLAALEKLMRHLGLAKEITPLDALLAAIGPDLGDEVRRALAASVPEGGGASGSGGDPPGG